MLPKAPLQIDVHSVVSLVSQSQHIVVSINPTVQSTVAPQQSETHLLTVFVSAFLCWTNMYLKQYSSFRIQFDLTLFTLDSRKLYPRYAKSIWSPLYQLGRTMVVRTVTRLRTFCNKSVMTY